MKFKVGDEVRFLNEEGGGKVTKIVSPSMVNVEIEAGFEMPTLTSELLLVEKKEEYKRPTFTDFQGPLAEMRKEQVKEEAPEEEYEEDGRIFELTNYPHREKVSRGIYLAMVPHDQQWLVGGMLDVYLVNHTQNDVLYSVFLKNEKGQFDGFDYGSMAPSTMIMLDSIQREELEKWRDCHIQALFHPEQTSNILQPLHTDVKVKAVKLMKENAYMHVNIIDGKVFLISVGELKSMQKVLSMEEEKKLVEQPEKPKVKPRPVKAKAFIDKFRTSDREAEVDLHIEKIVENYEDLSSHEKFTKQRELFTKALNSAIIENYHMVTFIHGVGNGVLKAEIMKILKDYEELDNRSASIAKFGVGAIDVMIKPMK